MSERPKWKHRSYGAKNFVHWLAWTVYEAHRVSAWLRDERRDRLQGAPYDKAAVIEVCLGIAQEKFRYLRGDAVERLKYEVDYSLNEEGSIDAFIDHPILDEWYEYCAPDSWLAEEREELDAALEGRAPWE